MEVELVVFMLALLIVAGCAIIWMAMQSRRQLREMQHRERLAMIERGIAPPADLDATGFEQSLGRYGSPENDRAIRSRTAGILMIGLGVAFMFLVSFAAREPNVGVGVGGAFAVLGGAFFVNAMMLRRSGPRPSARPFNRPEPPAPPSSPRPGA